MANSKELVQLSEWSPAFVEELLPVSKQVSLLFHISYLCLAKFPNLERLLRKRAVETQMLFGSSETLLLKCVGTGQNLVSSLFPMLIVAIEKNKPCLAIRYLEKSRTWVHDIIADVEMMMQSYTEHNNNVATTTSDIITEKSDTEKKTVQLSQEDQAMNETIKKLDEELAKVEKELEENAKMINAKSQELQSHIKDVTRKNSGLCLLMSVVPFIGAITKSIYDVTIGPGAAEKTISLQTQVDQLISEKSNLKQKQWDIHGKKIGYHLKSAKLQIDLGAIPSPVHLKEVQRYLSKILQILIQLKKLWGKVESMLETMKQKTFVNEDLIEDPDFKDQFVNSIQYASQIWSDFGGSCIKCAQMFKIQSKDAYAFLEIDPSSLSDDVWEKEYDSVMAQLQEIKVFEGGPIAIQE
ncbi:uncharacterized protein LOC143522427 [Brachyhypopomus gauderio]|uniref:uncharacterized protein LOC143522427 n=1 Tax=Brachyhypopomus gauderio TaxID=698409 RepID=UPI00404192D0